MITIKRYYLWESIFSITENASFYEQLAEVDFDASEENQLLYFQNAYFFIILWGCHEPYNQVKCRWRNEIISECFTIKNHGFTFVSFSSPHSLYILFVCVPFVNLFNGQPKNSNLE